MEQLELFEFSPEELMFLEMIRNLEKKTREIDLLKLEVTHLKLELEEAIREILEFTRLKSKLEEAIREINILSDPFEDFCILSDPFEDFCDTFSYDEEFDHLSSTSHDYLVEQPGLTFENIKPTKETTFH